MRRYVQLVAGVYDFSPKFRLEVQQVARGAHLRPKTTDSPSTLWPLPFNHVLSADTKFRYASRSKFLSSGLVITVKGARQDLAISKKGMLRSFELLRALYPRE